MDYIFLSSVCAIVVWLLVSYDIACQWSKNLPKRINDFPDRLRINLSERPVRFAIPKKHIRVHGPNHSRFSFNFLKWVGRTYGEGIESHWSHMNPVALSAREMSLEGRHELMNDHWSSWNWQKVTGLGIHSIFLLSHDHTNIVCRFVSGETIEGKP